MRCGDGEDGVLGEAMLIMISLLHLGWFVLLYFVRLIVETGNEFGADL
jgi:hypothetical protein